MKLFCILGVVSLLSVVELEATSISEFSCQKRNLAVTVDAHLDLLYIDGIEITNLPNADIWDGPDVVDLPCTARLIAIHGRSEPGWGKAAILASTDDEYVLTNSSWKCSNISQSGWEEIGFDDSAWVSAIEYGHNGDDSFVEFIPGISTNAIWIWLRLALPTDEVIDAEVYCRKRLALSFCTSSPCEFGGTCIQESNGGYYCICAPGYSGQNCSTEINYCESSPCVNGGSCLPIVNGYVCQCQSGYTDDNCECVTNNCASFPCLNGGTCYTGINDYTCVCPPEWTGVRCDTPTNFCDSRPCANGGSCEPMVNGYLCQCPPGYSGDNCEEEINYCETSPCANGGSCEPIVNGYVCQCPSEYTDDNCDEEINYCDSSPCPNEFLCLPIEHGYVCQCQSGYSGDNCEFSNTSSTACQSFADIAIAMSVLFSVSLSANITILIIWLCNTFRAKKDPFRKPENVFPTEIMDLSNVSSAPSTYEEIRRPDESQLHQNYYEKLTSTISHKNDQKSAKQN